MAKAVLLRDGYTCQMCGVLLRPGKSSRYSGVADHTIPAVLRPDLIWNEDNIRSVCRTCHSVCHSIERRHPGDAEAIAKAKLAYRPVGLDGYPVDPVR